jgi:quaternary ammonium compound-resistance protein SugE
MEPLVEPGGAETTKKRSLDTLLSIYIQTVDLLIRIHPMYKAWAFLLIAAGFEAAWTYSLKKVSLNSIKYAISENPFFSVPVGKEIGYLLLYLGLGGANIFFLSLSLKSIPLTLAIASWTAISLVFIKLFDVFVLKTPTNSLEIFFLTLIIVGIIGLKFSSAN